MKIKEIRCHNLAEIYDKICEFYNDEKADNTQFGPKTLPFLLQNASITFEVSDVTVLEFCYLKEIATTAIRTSPAQFDRVLEGFNQKPIKSFYDILVAFAKMLPQNGPSPFTTSGDIPSALVTSDCAVTFTGTKLADLLCFYDPVNLAIDNATIGKKTDPCFTFLNMVDSMAASDKRNREEEPSSLFFSGSETNLYLKSVPYRDEVTKKWIYNGFASRFMTKLYNSITVSNGQKAEWAEYYLKDRCANTSKGLGGIITPSYPLFTDMRGFKDHIASAKDAQPKAPTEIPNDTFMNVLAENTLVHCNMVIELAQYYQLISILPYHWFIYTGLPKVPDIGELVEDGLKRDISTGTELSVVNVAWDHYKRFNDTWHSILKEMSDEKKIKTFGPIIYNLLAPMNAPVYVSLDIPILEGVMILKETYNTYKSHIGAVTQVRDMRPGGNGKILDVSLLEYTMIEDILYKLYMNVTSSYKLLYTK